MNGSWKIYLLGTSKRFEKTELKISLVFLNYIFAQLDKTTTKTSCCEVSHQSFFLGNMNDYINVPKRDLVTFIKWLLCSQRCFSNSWILFLLYNRLNITGNKASLVL